MRDILLTQPRALTHRPRRLRHSPALRDLVRETTLAPDDLIYPLFIRPGEGVRQAIATMPGQSQLSIDCAVDEASEAWARGVRAVILFGIPRHKDELGSENADPNGIVPGAIRALKAALPDLLVISDMCFCEYTDHGHCGLLNQSTSPHYLPHLPDGYLLNDATLDALAEASVVHARAGADLIAPSGMLDGMVGAIRQGLDQAGFTHTAIMSYGVKYASGFYGPFREAAESPPQFGDRRGYQMDPANGREALREAALDVEEGADILMVKPALPYLDVLRELRHAHPLPLAAYHVSGEYAMLHAAAERGWLDLEQCALETLTSIKRAGADMIITYFAKEAAGWLNP